MIPNIAFYVSTHHQLLVNTASIKNQYWLNFKCMLIKSWCCIDAQLVDVTLMFKFFATATSAEACSWWKIDFLTMLRKYWSWYLWQLQSQLQPRVDEQLTLYWCWWNVDIGICDNCNHSCSLEMMKDWFFFYVDETLMLVFVTVSITAAA